MGNNSYIVIESDSFDVPLAIYGHWVGDDNVRAVEDTLLVTDRIGDASYLAAQIFHTLTTQHHYDGKSGFGLSVGDPFNAWIDAPTVYVDADKGEYSVGGDVWYDRWAMPIERTCR